MGDGIEKRFALYSVFVSITLWSRQVLEIG